MSEDFTPSPLAEDAGVMMDSLQVKETQPFTPPLGMRHNPYYFLSAIISLYTGNKTFTKPHRFNPSIHLQNYYQKYF